MPAITQLEPPLAPRTTMISSLADVVRLAAESRLLRSPYVELRRVSCGFHEGILTLQGCVPRHYLKQVAQEIVSPVSGVVKIENRLHVSPLPG